MRVSKVFSSKARNDSSIRKVYLLPRLSVLEALFLHHVRRMHSLWAREQPSVQLPIQMDSVCQSLLPLFTKMRRIDKDNHSHNLPAAVETIVTKYSPIKNIYKLVNGPSGSYCTISTSKDHCPLRGIHGIL